MGTRLRYVQTDKRRYIINTKMLRYFPEKHDNSYSSDLEVLPYGYQVGESCHRQSIYRVETGILKNSVNISMDHRVERRFKNKII